MSFEEHFESQNGDEAFADENIDGFEDHESGTTGEEYKLDFAGLKGHEEQDIDYSEKDSNEEVNEEDNEEVHEKEEGKEADSQKEETNKLIANSDELGTETTTETSGQVNETPPEMNISGNDNKTDINGPGNVTNTGQANETTTGISTGESGFDFKLFLVLLKDTKAEPILKYTRSFINQVLRSERWYSFREQKKLIEDFEEFIYRKFEIYEPFKGMDASNINNCRDCMEKLITNKLYSRIFSPHYYARYTKYVKMKPNEEVVFPEDHLKLVKSDRVIWENIKLFGGIISLENLEITSLTEEHTAVLSKFLAVFNKELCKMGKYRSPRDKLVCLLNSCKILFSYLKKVGSKGLSADDFMPLLIWSIFSLPAQDHENYYLQSTVSYIENLRQSRFLRGEESYYLISFQGALQFVSELSENNMFEKLKVEDETSFQNKLNERMGFMTALKLEKEEQVMKKARDQTLENQQQQQSEPRDTTTAWPLNGWFNSASPSVQDESLLKKFSSLLTGASEEEAKQAEEGSLHGDGAHESRAQESRATATTTLEGQQSIETQIKQAQKEELGALMEMFPQMEESVVRDVYVSKGRNVTLATEAILEML